MSVLWRKLRVEDARQLRDWLAEREDFACAFAWRLFGEPTDAPRFDAGATVLAGFDGGTIVGAVLFARGGMVFPVFVSPPEREAARVLGRFLSLRIGAPASAMGREADVAAFASLARLEPALSIRYVTMRLDARACALAPVSEPAPDGVRVRRAGPADLEALLPLQAAYEREEVLTSMHVFDARVSEAGLVRSLAEQRVWLAEHEGRPVAKAQTNARGLRMEQAGGIYVEPALRGRGVGRALVAALLADIGSAGRGATLFVKRGNAVARALYRGLGMEETGPFRIDYWNS
ncbi:MAG: GNAT family N-acetyltransferase [Spirochaetales bacterium]|nr:GNAT family N-acetyltransferase [Spirochaetales bacterium]